MQTLHSLLVRKFLPPIMSLVRETTLLVLKGAGYGDRANLPR